MLVQLYGVDHREAVGEMQLGHRVKVDHGLSAHEPGIASTVLEGFIAVGEHCLPVGLGEPVGKDVVLYAVCKEAELCRHEGRRVVKTQVKLPAELGLEVLVASLIAQGALVHAVGAQLADVGGAEAASNVNPEVHLLVDVVDGA